MNILIVNGSPKGEYSITLQTSLYLQKHRQEHSFAFLDAGAGLRALEKDFSPAAEKLARADLILFSYPVYTFLAPSQLHRFLELLKTSGISVKGKIATQITTSKHFYDITAHTFIRENCADLGLRFIRGLSADMDDLLTEKGRKEALDFFDFLIFRAEHGLFETEEPRPAPPAYPPVPAAEPAGENKPGDVVIVADLAPEDERLAAMIALFRSRFPRKTRLVNIHDFPFRGGCISCFRCAAEGNCVYQDGFQRLLREEIQTAEAIVPAFTIRDHSMGARFKMYDDRQFCNGHRTVTMGMPFGYLVCGPYSAERNLRAVIESRAEVGGNFLAGVAADETDPAGEIDALCARLNYAVERRYTQPADFRGVGGMKIFRDLIWQMQGLMRADHRFFKAHGQYDFPQRHRGKMLKMYPVGLLMRSKKLMAKAGTAVNEGMIAPYRKALEK